MVNAVSSSNFAAGGNAGLGRAAMMMNFIQMMDEWIEMMKKNRGDTQTGVLAVPMIDNILPNASTYGPKNGVAGAIQKFAAAQMAASFVAIA
jgi:hypothetical protein